MTRIVALAILAAAIVFSGPASAHRPYFTQVERILLPNGEVGEVRLLYGDGIMGPDPVRVILIDREGRLRARSEKALSMALSCRLDGRCTIFHFTHDRILEPDPATFRSGPLVPGLSSEDRNGLWDIEDGYEHWGFVAREPTATERREGYGALLSTLRPLLVFNAMAGAVSSIMLSAALIIVRTKRERYWETSVAVLTITAILGLALFAALVANFFTLLAGFPPGAWLHAWVLPFFTGALLLQLVRFLWRILGRVRTRA